MEKRDLESRFGLSMNLENEDADGLKKAFNKFALFIDSYVDDSREKVIAIERLEECFMWCVKSMRT